MGQEQYVQSLEDFYLHSEFDEEKAHKTIKLMYEKAKVPLPKFIITLNSPFYFNYAFQFVKEMLKQIDGQIYWKTFKDDNWVHLKEKIKSHPPFRVEDTTVWEKTCNDIYLQVKQQIMELNKIPLEFGLDINGVIYRENKAELVYDRLPDYLNTIKDEVVDVVASTPTARSLVNHYINVFYFPELREGRINSISCFENICFLSKPPTFIRINEVKQLDCKNDYALYWDGGVGKYFVRGVRFDKEMFIKAFKMKALLPEELMQIQNTEQKAVLIDEYGYDYIKSCLKNLKVIDTFQTTSKVTGKVVNYELFEYDFQPRVRIRVIQVECHSTHHKTFIGVPREKDTENCLDAIGWTFGFAPGEYKPIVES